MTFPRLRKKRLQFRADECRTIDRLYLADDSLAVVSGNGVVIMSGVESGNLVTCHSQVFRHRPLKFSMSTSGRYLTVVCGTRNPPQCDLVETWDATTGQRIARMETPDSFKMSAEASILTVAEQELLLVSHTRSVLEAYDLRDMRRLLVCDFRKSSFIFTGFQPLNCGDMFLAFGHIFSEYQDSLVVFSFRDLVARQGEDIRVPKEPINEYSHRVAAGPADSDSVIIFKDADDQDEREENDDEDDMWWFRGFYTRRLTDGKLLGRIPYNASCDTGAPLFSLPGMVVIGCRDRVEVLRHEGERQEVVSIPAVATAFDTIRNRFVVLSESGEMHLYYATPAAPSAATAAR